MSSQKLWIAYETPEMTYGPTRVSIDGCEYVAHLLNKLYEGPLLGIPKDSPIILYQPDGKTDIKTTATIKSLQDVGKDRDAPLIVRTISPSPESINYNLFEAGIVTAGSKKRKRIEWGEVSTIDQRSYDPNSILFGWKRITYQCLLTVLKYATKGGISETFNQMIKVNLMHRMVD